VNWEQGQTLDAGSGIVLAPRCGVLRSELHLGARGGAPRHAYNTILNRELLAYLVVCPSLKPESMRVSLNMVVRTSALRFQKQIIQESALQQNQRNRGNLQELGRRQELETMARAQRVKHALRPRRTQDLDFFGFVCPACNFRLRLSDRHVSECIVDLLKHEVGVTSLECTECGHEQQYSQEDLLMFLPGGRQCPVGMRFSLKGNAQKFGTSDSRYIVGKKQGAG
jgi:transcription elongation factor Elf1